ncbi:DNA gyrase subunit A, partial [Candidatus Dojkabacteria bacterium]|nr:DNA gyrase subunit A [Candidatus Dojkabacteria bacterium]
KYKYLFFATKNGTVKKTSLEEFEKIRSNGLISINLDEGDELRWVKPTTGENEVLLVTSFARSIRFKEKDVRPTGRATMGVRGIKFRDKSDEVIAMDVVRKGEMFVMSISANGYGKSTPLDQFPMQGRGGQGVFAFQLRDKTGKLVVSRVIDHPKSELLIMSEDGNAIRLKSQDLPKLNRQTSGVRLIKLAKGDKVAAVAFL